MRCPNCDVENASTSIYCENCGTLLQSFTNYEPPEQSEYQAPSPPPLNGHNPPLPPPPPLAYDYSEIPSTFNADESPLPNEYSSPLPSAIEPGSRSTLFYADQNARIADFTHHLGIFSGILYFLGDFIIILGIFATLALFGTNNITRLLSIILSLAILIASIVFFVYLVRHHQTPLRWWHRILLLVGAAVAAFTLLVVVQLFTSSDFVNAFVTSGMFVVYGLAWCAIAVW
jgi:hypothetical protein